MGASTLTLDDVLTIYYDCITAIFGPPEGEPTK